MINSRIGVVFTVKDHPCLEHGKGISILNIPWHLHPILLRDEAEDFRFRRWHRIALGSGYHLGKLMDGLMTEDLLDRKIQTLLPGFSTNLDCSNRISAQIEDVVMDADSFKPEYFSPDARQHFLNVGA